MIFFYGGAGTHIDLVRLGAKLVPDKNLKRVDIQSTRGEKSYKFYREELFDTYGKILYISLPIYLLPMLYRSNHKALTSYPSATRLLLCNQLSQLWDFHYPLLCTENKTNKTHLVKQKFRKCFNL